MDYLKIADKTFLITGVSNKKSVATSAANVLKEAGAKLIFSVQSQEQKQKVESMFAGSKCYLLDVEKLEQIKFFSDQLKDDGVELDGLLHSIAFANFRDGVKPFHQTSIDDFQQAMNISCFSLVSLSNALKDLFTPNASVVTISISDTLATSYGYMGPIKAMLETAVCYLAKSFSEFSQVRFNAVCAGPLKTSASAGIPGYINNYLTAEQFMLRKKALKTEEVADTIVFLLSSRSSGVNASKIVVDGGMRVNHFDQKIVNLIADHL